MGDRTANRFMLNAVQEWGQPEGARVKAVQDLLDAAGFNATATCFPVFGGIWPEPCSGADADAASEWLNTLTKTMPRGKYEREVEHIEKAISARKESA